MCLSGNYADSGRKLHRTSEQIFFGFWKKKSLWTFSLIQGERLAAFNIFCQDSFELTFTNDWTINHPTIRHPYFYRVWNKWHAQNNLHSYDSNPMHLHDKQFPNWNLINSSWNGVRNITKTLVFCRNRVRSSGAIWAFYFPNIRFFSEIFAVCFEFE